MDRKIIQINSKMFGSPVIAEHKLCMKKEKHKYSTGVGALEWLICATSACIHPWETKLEKDQTPKIEVK